MGEIKNESTANVPMLLTASEAAKMLKIGRTKVYEMLAASELPAIRIGTAVRVPLKALVDWIERHTSTAA